MARVLIVGFGSPLRRDDGFGWHVALAIQDKPFGDDVEIRACHQLTPELAEPLSRARYAIFIDAADDQPPGQLALRQVEPESGPARFSHHLTPGSLLSYAEICYGAHPPEAYLLTVGVSDLELGEHLSDGIARMVPPALKQIEALYAGFGAPISGRGCE